MLDDWLSRLFGSYMRFRSLRRFRCLLLQIAIRSVRSPQHSRWVTRFIKWNCISFQKIEFMLFCRNFAYIPYCLRKHLLKLICITFSVCVICVVTTRMYASYYSCYFFDFRKVLFFCFGLFFLSCKKINNRLYVDTLPVVFELVERLGKFWIFYIWICTLHVFQISCMQIKVQEEKRNS